jgi:hypothetical protein
MYKSIKVSENRNGLLDQAFLFPMIQINKGPQVIEALSYFHAYLIYNAIQ